MNEIIAFFKTNPVALMVPAIIIVGIIMQVYYLKKNKDNTTKWLKKHPDSLKLYVDGGTLGKYSISLYTINNEQAATFRDGIKTGYYVLPGKNILGDLKCEYQKTNILTRTKKIFTFGPIDLEAEFKHGVNYKISYTEGNSYDKEAGFVIEEI